MSHLITEEKFQTIFKDKLQERYERALTIFKQYGEHLSWDVTNVLLHAADQNKVDEVIAELEKHWEEHLQYQHPEIRGLVKDRLKGVNPTEQMFLQICEKVLHLKTA